MEEAMEAVAAVVDMAVGQCAPAIILQIAAHRMVSLTIVLEFISLPATIFQINVLKNIFQNSCKLFNCSCKLEICPRGVWNQCKNRANNCERNQ